MTSLRDRLRARQTATARVALPVDPGAHRAAVRDLEAAQQAVAAVLGDPTVLRARVTAAQQAVDSCAVEMLVLRTLPVPEWEALVALHPPTPEQRAAGWDWDLTTFRPALLAASVVPADDDPGLTEQDWSDLATSGNLATGELDLLFGTAVNLNARPPVVSVGKG